MAGQLPLQGLKVLEFAGLAPGPFAGMLLADAGASVLRVDRVVAGAAAIATTDMLARHKSSIAVDLKTAGGVSLVKKLASKADVLIDPFRPGVLEKMQLGPDDLLSANPGLIYARMTGFRRDGRYAAMAGHDINYLAVSGVLSMLGRAGQAPHPPTNILGDFAGGGAVLFQGILLALLTRATTGKGQVVEANMVDGASYLASMPRMGLKTPIGAKPRGTNILDGGSPFYDTYATQDGKWVAVGALEPQFFAQLIKGLGLQGQGWEKGQRDESTWPKLRTAIADTFKSKPRAHWEQVFDGTDACVTPVLEYAEIETDPAREGDLRPIVTLRDTPLLAVQQGVPADKASTVGRGPGVPGNGYDGVTLTPGDGGERTLRDWMGWESGREYEKSGKGFVIKGGNVSKL